MITPMVPVLQGLVASSARLHIKGGVTCGYLGLALGDILYDTGVMQVCLPP